MRPPFITNIVSVPSNEAAFIGDSHMARWSSNTTASFTRYAQGWPFWMQVLSGQRLNIVSDQSRGGAFMTIDYDAQVDVALRSSATVYFIGGWWNDLEAGIPVASIKVALTRLVARLVAAGKVVYLVTGFPVLITGTAYTATRQQNNILLNNFMKTLMYSVNSSIQRKAVKVLDIWQVCVNKTTGNLALGAAGSQGDDHPNNATHYYAGKEAARLISLDFPDPNYMVGCQIDNVVTNTISNNLFPNPLLINNAAGVASNLTVTGLATSATSIVARADGYGNDQKLDMTFSAALGAANNISRWTTDNMSASIQSGDRLSAFVGLELVIGTAAPSAMRVLMSITTANAGQIFSVYGEHDTTYDVAFPENFSGVYKTPEIYVDPAYGAVSSCVLQFTAFPSVDGTSSVSTSRLSNRRFAAP